MFAGVAGEGAALEVGEEGETDEQGGVSLLLTSSKMVSMVPMLWPEAPRWEICRDKEGAETDAERERNSEVEEKRDGSIAA